VRGLETFQRLLDAAGVVYSVEPRVERRAIPGSAHPPDEAGHWEHVPVNPPASVVVITAQGRDHPTTSGYGEFYAAFTFGPDGTLDHVGIWE
jgi:hypothetical protein